MLDVRGKPLHLAVLSGEAMARVGEAVRLANDFCRQAQKSKAWENRKRVVLGAVTITIVVNPAKTVVVLEGGASPDLFFCPFDLGIPNHGGWRKDAQGAWETIIADPADGYLVDMQEDESDRPLRWFVTALDTVRDGKRFTLTSGRDNRLFKELFSTYMFTVPRVTSGEDGLEIGHTKYRRGMPEYTIPWRRDDAYKNHARYWACNVPPGAFYRVNERDRELTMSVVNLPDGYNADFVRVRRPAKMNANGFVAALAFGKGNAPAVIRAAPVNYVHASAQIGRVMSELYKTLPAEVFIAGAGGVGAPWSPGVVAVPCSATRYAPGARFTTNVAHTAQLVVGATTLSSSVYRGIVGFSGVYKAHEYVRHATAASYYRHWRSEYDQVQKNYIYGSYETQWEQSGALYAPKIVPVLREVLSQAQSADGRLFAATIVEAWWDLETDLIQPYVATFDSVFTYEAGTVAEGKEDKSDSEIRTSHNNRTRLRSGTLHYRIRSVVDSAVVDDLEYAFAPFGPFEERRSADDWVAESGEGLHYTFERRATDTGRFVSDALTPVAAGCLAAVDIYGYGVSLPGSGYVAGDPSTYKTAMATGSDASIPYTACVFANIDAGVVVFAKGQVKTDVTQLANADVVPGGDHLFDAVPELEFNIDAVVVHFGGAQHTFTTQFKWTEPPPARMDLFYVVSHSCYDITDDDRPQGLYPVVRPPSYLAKGLDQDCTHAETVTHTLSHGRTLMETYALPTEEPPEIPSAEINGTVPYTFPCFPQIPVSWAFRRDKKMALLSWPGKILVLDVQEKTVHDLTGEFPSNGKLWAGFAGEY